MYCRHQGEETNDVREDVHGTGNRHVTYLLNSSTTCSRGWRKS